MAGLVALDLPGGPAFVDALRQVWDRGDAMLPVDRRLSVAARERMLQTLRPTSIIGVDGERPLDGDPTEDGDALVVATSGTTGVAKGVVLTHDAVRASALATSERLGVTGRDHWLACLPLAHVGGLSVVTRALATGTALTVLPGFDAAAVTRAAAAGATLVSLVATALRRVDPDAFRWIVLGGSRPPADRPPNSVATYGMTETGSGVVYDGLPLDGVEVMIDQPDPLTGLGEVLLRGPMLLRTYRHGVDPRGPAGFLHTGDLGRWLAADIDGAIRLHVDGRRGDLIITGGENVWPDAVEAVLIRHPSVGDVAVAGVTDQEWGARVVAWVVPAPDGTSPSLVELRAAVTTEIASFAAPKEMRIVDHIPRTALGKVVRSALVGDDASDGRAAH